MSVVKDPWTATRPTKPSANDNPSAPRFSTAARLRAGPDRIALRSRNLFLRQPLVAASNYPPDFYVPSRMFVDRAVSILGRPGPGEERGATVSVSPARLVCTARVMRPSTPWPTASWVVVALDLARDLSRGREILERWKPPLGVERVW